MDKQQKERTKELILQRMQAVSDHAKKIGELFGLSTITINSFNAVVSDLKIDAGKDDLSDFINKVNAVLDNIFEQAEKFAVINDSKVIPIEYIEILVETAKRSFTKTFEDENN